MPLGETQTHAVKGAPGQDEQIGQRAEVDMYHMSPPAFPGALALSASGGRGGAVRHDRLLWHDSDTGGAAGRIATAGAAAAASSVATPSGQATMASGRAGGRATEEEEVPPAVLGCRAAARAPALQCVARAAPPPRAPPRPRPLQLGGAHILVLRNQGLHNLPRCM